MTAVVPVVAERERAKTSHWLLALVLYGFFALFLIWPIGQVVKSGFQGRDGGFTLEYVGLIFQDPVLVQGLINSALTALGVTLLTLLIALPLAVLSVRYEFWGRGLLSGLLLVPLVLPPFVGAIGMRMVLGRYGPLTLLVGGGELGIDWMGRLRLLGIIFVEALGLYPIMLLNIQAALANIDPAMEQAAANLGASRWTVFRKITLPLIRPGVFAGCTLVMIWSFTELGTPLMFDFYTITPVQVFERLTDVGEGNPLPFALVVVMLLASVFLYVMGKVVLGRGFSAATTKASVRATARKLTGVNGFLAALPFMAVFCLAVLPHLAVVLTSVCATGAWYKTLLPTSYTLSHYVEALHDPLAVSSIANSVKYASLATALAVVVGMGVAKIVVRSKVPGRGLLDALSMLPLAVPGLVLAFGYLSISIYFRNHFPQATWLNVQENPLILLVLAYTARRVPYLVRAAVAGLQQTPEDLELAAANLGASRRVVLWRITLPLILANLLAGALLAFAFAMLEVSDSLILAMRGEDYPITKAIWELSQRLGDGIHIASALGVWAMTLLILTILAASSLLGKKMGAMFRV